MLTDWRDIFADADWCEQFPEVYAPRPDWFSQGSKCTAVHTDAKRPGERVLRQGELFWCGD